MADDDSSQEKTEEATAKRLQDAREKGQIVRSKELASFVLLISGAGAILILGAAMVNDFMQFTRGFFTISRKDIFLDTISVSLLLTSIDFFIRLMAPFFVILFSAALLGPLLLGGWNFSTKALEPKIEKFNVLKGLKRMFSMNALMELVKALAKFMVIGVSASIIIYNKLDDFLQLGMMPIERAIVEGSYLVIFMFLLISASLIILAAVDVPFQLYEHAKKLRMTKQEVKDEYKNVEGKPEIKSKVRQLQRKLAQGRMMQEVPNADVVVTNPTHYAIALKYDPSSLRAPVVLAKGLDEVALKIREIADSYEVPIIESPPLARALYHTTELEQEVPEGLYVAVAQVLAYVYQLKRYQRGQADKPDDVPENLALPDEFQFD